MKKDYYIYPAIFEYEKGGISISFPDLPGCISCAANDEEALFMAKDALGLYIVCAEEDGEEYKTLIYGSKLGKIIIDSSLVDRFNAANKILKNTPGLLIIEKFGIK